MTTRSLPKTLGAASMRRLLKIPKKHDLPIAAIVAHVADLASGETFFDIAFRAEDGSRKSIRVPREIVRHHPAKMRDLLSKFGAALPTDQKKLETLTKKLSTDDAPNWLVVAPTLGWQQSGKAFVAHSRILGENGDGSSAKSPRLIPPGRDDVRSTAAMRQCGNLGSWKSEVAATARYSSTIALSLSVAFAAPLLSVIDWPTFMVVLFGPGKVGKSTAALAGASMYGLGREDDLPNWNQTEAALPEIVSQFNDLMLVLNGLETAKLKDRQLRDFLRSVTYILGDGVEMRRHSSWSAGQASRALAVWRTIALVTSEQSFDEIASRANDVRLDGERARAINVAAIASENSTVVDFYPKDVAADEASRKAWARQRLDALRAACAQHHGVALKPYLLHLMQKDRASLKSEVLVARDRFVASVKSHTTAEALNHAAKNMGLIYAGGAQAIQAGLLPLTEDDLLKRIRRCFLRSVATSTATADPRQEALRQLDRGLREALLTVGSAGVSDRLGVAKGNEADEYTVHVTGLFSTWFGGKQPAQAAALRWLCDEGFLVVRDRAAAAIAGFTIDSVRHTRRIQGKNCATIVFRDPRSRLREVLANKVEGK